MEYITNVLLSFVNYLPLMLVFLGCSWYFKSVRKILLKITGFVFVGVLLLVGATSSNTYKHTTNYDKQQDIYNVQMKTDTPIGDIVDKTLPPKKTDDQRKKDFEDKSHYSSNN
jgi:hypothetical protein